MKRMTITLPLLGLLVGERASAQWLKSPAYIGRAPEAAAGGCGEAISITTDGLTIVNASYGELSATANNSFLRDDGALSVHFAPHVFFRGRASGDGLSIRGRLVVLTADLDHIVVVQPYRLHATRVPAHVMLSGLTLSITDSNGTATFRREPGGQVLFGAAWNTRADSFNNLYVFTNRPNRQVFLNAGNSDASLKPNIPLGLGTHTFHFAGAPGFETGFFTLTLYFDHDPTKRISGFVAMNDSAPVRPVPVGVPTFDQYFGAQPSSGKLSQISTNLMIVTLTDLRLNSSPHDRVGGNCARPDGGPDTAGTFSLRVTAE